MSHRLPVVVLLTLLVALVAVPSAGAAKRARSAVAKVALSQLKVSGQRVTVAGLVLVRQKPGSAKGVMFMTIEDETDVANVIVWPSLYEKQRRLILSSGMMAVRGRYQKERGVTHLIAEHLIDLSDLLRSVGDRDSPFSMRHGHGDEARIGTRDRLREGPKETVDVVPAEVPDQRVEAPAIRIATRDFR